MNEKDFPILTKHKQLVYLDNAATSQKPKQVINAIIKYYSEENANVHRGIYDLSEKTTEKYEAVREKVALFINAHPDEIVFTKNATEAMNILAFGLQHLIKKKDNIVLSETEHHSNLVPWQIVAKKKKATIQTLPLKKDSTIDWEKAEKIIKKAHIISLTQLSNALGVVYDIARVVRLAKGIVCVDGAQSVPHFPVDVKALGCDALVFSAHKMLGPTGVGILYAKKTLLAKLTPLLYGGNMIKRVAINETELQEAPMKFEAGTPNIAGVIGLGIALDYLNNIGMQKIWKHNQALHKYAMKQLSLLKEIECYGKSTSGIIAFNLKNAHAHDVAALLNSFGIAVRAGHHCAMPLAKKMKYPASVRVSFYLYNNKKDVDTLIRALKKVIKVLCYE